MNILNNRSLAWREHGFTMIEVLVTVVILAFGLLGVAGLQGRMQLAEIESYQRAQGIVLLQDIVARINANRKNTLNYVSTQGTGNPIQACGALTGANRDLCEWNNELLGAAENNGTCTSADQTGCRGAMIGARGCITSVSATQPYEVAVAVAWQGVTPTLAPTTTTCGQGSYGNDATRRAIVTHVTIGCLQNDKTTGLCCPAGGCP